MKPKRVQVLFRADADVLQYLKSVQQRGFVMSFVVNEAIRQHSKPKIKIK